jgi:hypothetical protein
LLPEIWGQYGTRYSHWEHLPSEVHHETVDSHGDFFENLLSTILGDMILGHHTVRLLLSATSKNRAVTTPYLRVYNCIDKKNRE